MGAFLLIRKPDGVDVEGVERLYSDAIGVFEAALIKYIDPGIAKYWSDYGYNFYDAIPLKAKITDYIKLYAPVRLRAYIRKNFWNMTDAKLKLGGNNLIYPIIFQKSIVIEYSRVLN